MFKQKKKKWQWVNRIRLKSFYNKPYSQNVLQNPYFLFWHFCLFFWVCLFQFWSWSFLMKNFKFSIFIHVSSQICIGKWWQTDKLVSKMNSPNEVDIFCTMFHQKILKTRCCGAKWKFHFFPTFFQLFLENRSFTNFSNKTLLKMKKKFLKIFFLFFSN